MNDPQSPQKRYRIVVVDSAGRKVVIVRDSTLEAVERLKASLGPRFPDVLIEEQPEGEVSFLP